MRTVNTTKMYVVYDEVSKHVRSGPSKSPVWRHTFKIACVKHAESAKQPASLFGIAPEDRK